MRRLLLATLLALIPAAPAAAATPAGFKVTISDGQKVECAYLAVAKTLQCLNYTRVVNEQCDAGGPVFATELRRTGKPKDTFFCVDEAFHGWKTLKARRDLERRALLLPPQQTRRPTALHQQERHRHHRQDRHHDHHIARRTRDRRHDSPEA